MEFVKAFLKKQPQKESSDVYQRTYNVSYSNNKSSLPNTSLRKWSTNIISACTGPNAGITQLDLQSVTMTTDREIAGVTDWTPTATEYNCGISESLYEEDETGINIRKCVGDPIADVYASVVRSNNTIAAIGDGCGWGKKPRLAARCAVQAAIEYVSNNTVSFNKQPSSETLLNILRSAMDASQECIIKHKATTTTLSIAVTCQLTNGTWALFTASVGDSRIFVYSIRHQTLVETTIGSHPSDGIRSAKNCGGALGPAYGTSPDMDNLSFSFTPIVTGDVIVLMTDGISDNFLPKTPINTKMEIDFTLVSMSDVLLPTPHSSRCDRNGVPHSCCLISHELHRAIRNHHNQLCSQVTAKSISKFLIESVKELTEEKRQYHMRCIKNGVNGRLMTEDPELRREIRQKQTGKLDHATVLSYTVVQYKCP